MIGLGINLWRRGGGSGIANSIFFFDGEQAMGRQMIVVGDSIAGMHALLLTPSAITLDGSTTMTVTCASHAMLPGQPVYGFATTNESLNGVFTVTTTPDANTFTVTLPAAASGTVTARTGSFQCYNTALLSDRGMFNWMSALNNACFDIVGVCAESGSAATYLPTLISNASGLSYQWVGIISGINDVAADATGPTVATRIITAVDSLVSAGKNVIIQTLGPWDAGNPAYTAARYQQAMQANALLKAYASRTRGVYIADSIAAGTTSTSTTGAPLSNILADGIHPTPKGAFTYADRFATDYPNTLPSGLMMLPTTAMLDEGVAVGMRQLWNNPLMVGTAGALQGDAIPTGSAATSNTIYLGGATGAAVCTAGSIAPSSGFGYVQRIDWTPAATGHQMQYYPSDSIADVLDGESVRAAAVVKCGLTAGGATANLSRISLRMYLAATGIVAGTKYATAMLYPSDSTVANFPQLNDRTLTLLTPQRTIEGAVFSGLTTLRPTIAAYVSGADTIRLDISRTAIWAE